VVSPRLNRAFTRIPLSRLFDPFRFGFFDPLRRMEPERVFASLEPRGL